LEVQNVPVFYLPYLTVPIGDTRKTGFLYPTASYGSRNGYSFEVPIYWKPKRVSSCSRSSNSVCDSKSSSCAKLIGPS
ncbi:hypothetical protein, partial [Vibrio cholerae]|uniref:hypothetical protein n=1 Tax=Vibrio cholerae TaxID=666 RepID=UPI0011250F18